MPPADIPRLPDGEPPPGPRDPTAARTHHLNPWDVARPNWMSQRTPQKPIRGSAPLSDNLGSLHLYDINLLNQFLHDLEIIAILLFDQFRNLIRRLFFFHL
jgi:hypothetical protein